MVSLEKQPRRNEGNEEKTKENLRALRFFVEELVRERLHDQSDPGLPCPPAATREHCRRCVSKIPATCFLHGCQ
jgi:hypothetical protein